MAEGRSADMLTRRISHTVYLSGVINYRCYIIGLELSIMDTFTASQNPTLSFARHRKRRYEEISHPSPKRKRKRKWKKKGTPPSIKAFGTSNRRQCSIELWSRPGSRSSHCRLFAEKASSDRCKGCLDACRGSDYAIRQEPTRIQVP